MKSYQERKQQVAAINRKKSKEGRDIAPLPKVIDPERRENCRLNFRLFCETYFSAVFYLEFSEDHLRIIERIEKAILSGGLFALAMPRGSGKTALCVCAAEWAILYGHRSFMVLIGATEKASTDLLDDIATDFETNSLLGEDFPEVCYPFQRIQGIKHRAAGQLLNGERTRVGWTATQLVLPTVPNSVASGSRIKVAGITGRIRGMSAKLADGKLIRPNLVIIDDCQTDESANSPQQVEKRLATVNGSILGMAGPGKDIAGFMPITVIAKGDMADQLLNRKDHPEWQGERTQLLKSEPTNVKLWEQYAEIRGDCLRENRGIEDATKFYREHQAEMDEGAVASWPARYDPDEASAIQNAMEIKLRDEATFYAEYQNEPMTLAVDTTLNLVPEQILAKIIKLPRYLVPKYATRLTAFVDVQKDILFYLILASSDDFTLHIVDYGTYPEQDKGYFSIRDITKTLMSMKSGVSLEGAIYAGLTTLTDRLLTRKWTTEGAGQLSISRLMIDANWGDSTTVIKQFCRESKYSAIILPSYGRGMTADKKPMNEYRAETGVRSGWNWRLQPPPDRHIWYDTNSWKTFAAQRLLSSAGEKGNLSIFDGSPVAHRLYAEHLTAEEPKPTEDKLSGRIVNIWRDKPNRENHLLDCTVGAMVAASEQGAKFIGHEAAKGISRKRRKVQVTW